ncbi:hypothetical protein NAEGRDRAFT_80630 [Naegleria gruberi]|uniref:MJ1316 RNA cyclic group end recognition domain-containing protein n=1 Tax=Naegleria gruberi TaxID=5762 RepID=D2VNB1_NAEGR|nr:uncharacterized protein NAEGRDRAFT_80630 [Naegleria gruberi]EFC41622.1 hypothetical protein NAEGRDRAFT_80630 [Naegleria gruberi]|eukprot:XP_002674366.1 hypothetical protein NAEGRDRAFT_80630 [Naegleria gruberi strain NEG-M]
MSVTTLPVNNNTTTTNSTTTFSKNQLIAQEEAEWTKKKDRFLTCKEALNRIMWDSDLNDAYLHLSMIYKDRFEGDTFISYEEFLNSDLAEELPQHRIQQLIYRDEYVFWDKNNRIDLLSNGQLRELILKFQREEEERIAREQAEFTTVLQPTPTPETSTSSKKKNKKNKKIMKEFVRNQETVQQYNSSSSSEEEDDYDQYMEEYDEQYSRYLNH